jgi:alcohol dehydrogenase class IV
MDKFINLCALAYQTKFRKPEQATVPPCIERADSMIPTMMKSFRHFTPQLRIYQGSDCLDAIEGELERLQSRRAVIFCGSTLARAGSQLELVRQAMGGRLAAVYPGARADTPLPDVHEAVLGLQRLEADAIVAVGGGSAITMARAVNILLSEKGDIRTLCTRREASGKLHSPKLLAPKLPIIAIPTTPTTATVKAGSAVLDTREGKRLALYDPKTRARAVFIHPALVQSAPRQLFVSAALNTLALALEGLMSRAGDPMSDAMLMHATRLLAALLPRAATDDDLDVRSQLMMASILCGHGSDYTGAGMAIPIGHAISTRFDVEMGLSDSIMLPHVVRFNAEAAESGLKNIAIALDARRVPGSVAAVEVVLALEKLFSSLGLPRRLRDVGVTRPALAELAAISFDDWYLQNNPRAITDVTQVQHVLEEAW